MALRPSERLWCVIGNGPAAFASETRKLVEAYEKAL